MVEEMPGSLQWLPADAAGMFASTEATDFVSSLDPQDVEIGTLGEIELGGEQSELFSWDAHIPNDLQATVMAEETEEAVGKLDAQEVFQDLQPGSLQTAADVTQPFEYGSHPSPIGFAAPGRKHNGYGYASVVGQTQRSKSRLHWGLCNASDNTAKEYTRSTMTRNLIRIYHDSMENALSCWLTEHNCPYSGSDSSILPFGERKEWGPSWSNRVCIRVCRLDCASSSLRGRPLSAEEDTTAARALHLAIIAFASQWTQHAQKGTGLAVPAPIAYDERSIRERVWNEARHVMEHSAGIPSFRIAFANIIFSLAESPLDNGQDERLGHLLENDSAPRFLETANRQLFTFRHKYRRRKLEALSSTKKSRMRSTDLKTTDVLEMSKRSESPPVCPILASSEHRNTLSLLFWLGVMFDTLSAAMYQRPLVVSDEDSQIVSASTSVPDSEDRVDFDGWSIPQTGRLEKHDVWGDFFLRGPVERRISQVQPRWPCSYEEAASVLSEATPVKVLLYRRVTQLQTLIYRGASCDRLEDVIQKTLLVYNHWNCTYQSFMLDCVANHKLLPPRIQSWYVILDAHWHLAAMLLADAVETIDGGSLGSDTECAARESTELVSRLRIENALAVGELARSSLDGQEPTIRRLFHDSLNEVAFLAEPWTVVLIHSFAKAGYISLESLHAPGGQYMYAECFRQNCMFCICALQYLGRKSDMAFLIARDLSRSLDMKFSQSP